MDLLYWLDPWEPSPTVVVAVLAAGVLFARGVKKARVTPLRQFSFWLGLTALYVALHTRLDYFFEHEFFLHRAQHLVLHHLGPFFIALAYPGAAIRAGIPFRWRQRFVRPALAWRPVRATLDVVFNPVVAVVLFVGLIYFWLLSPIHFVAMLDWRLYRVMNWSMVIDGLLFWWLVVDPRPAPPARLAPGRRILVVVAAIPPQIVLGAMIFFTPQELYPIYSICGRAFTWLSPLRDQQIGGLLLWIPGSMMSVIGAVIALRHWLRLSARGRLRDERAAKRDAEREAGQAVARTAVSGARAAHPHVRDAVLVVHVGTRREAERAVEALQMGLRMQADRRVGPLRADVLERARQQRVAEARAAERGGRQHAADPDVGILRIGQQHAQVAGQPARFVICGQMPRCLVRVVDVAVHAILLDDEHRAARLENRIDLTRRQRVEGFPAPFERIGGGRVCGGCGCVHVRS